ncbi:MAG TPA: hypothetical protein VFQ91_21125 [Bryobacteraceae bacterium]|nr:hypothetical protein [Bryobacteraceae bacterium]
MRWKVKRRVWRAILSRSMVYDRIKSKTQETAVYETAWQELAKHEC